MCRVEYTVEGRTTFVFTQDLSLGGMQLRNVKLLARGAAVTFHLHLADSGKPVQVQGLVQRVADGSAGITFPPGQEAAVAAISDFVNQRLISRAAERAVGASGSASQIADLAMYYGEIGRIDDAIELYRKSLQKRPQELVLYEHMATLLLFRAEQGGDGVWALLNELESLVGRGLGIGKSRVLDAMSREVGEVRAAQMKRQAAALQRDKALLFKEATEHGKEAVHAAVAKRARELDKEFRDKLAGKDVRAALAKHKAEHDKRVAAMARQLTAVRKTIVVEEAKLAKHAAKIEKAQRVLDAATEKHIKAASAFDIAKREAKLDADRAKLHAAELEQRERAVTVRESRVATLEKLSALIDGLHLANAALRPPPPATPTRRSN